MKRIQNNARYIWNYIYLFQCVFVLMRESLRILVASYFMSTKNLRIFINHSVKRGGLSIFKAVKATPHIEFLDGNCFDPSEVYIYMSNHQSLFDIPLIFATVPGTIRFICKKELFKIPLLGRAMKKGECISVDRKNPVKREAFIKETKDKLSDGVSLWFFPEGTRSRENKLLPFKSGGFQLAKETKTKIVPVGIFNTQKMMPAKGFHLKLNQEAIIRIGQPIDISHDISELMAIVKTQIENLRQP